MGCLVVVQSGGGGWEGWAGRRRTSKQLRAVGVIIPPNAPCLPPVCCGSPVSGRLSALMQKVTWVIKWPSQGFVCVGVCVCLEKAGRLQWAAGSSCLVRAAAAAADSAACHVLRGYVLCNRPGAVWMGNACRAGCSPAEPWGVSQGWGSTGHVVQFVGSMILWTETFFVSFLFSVFFQPCWTLKTFFIFNRYIMSKPTNCTWLQKSNPSLL